MGIVAAATWGVVTGVVVTVARIVLTVIAIAKPAIVLNSRWTPAAGLRTSCY